MKQAAAIRRAITALPAEVRARAQAQSVHQPALITVSRQLLEALQR